VSFVLFACPFLASGDPGASTIRSCLFLLGLKESWGSSCRVVLIMFFVYFLKASRNLGPQLSGIVCSICLFFSGIMGSWGYSSQAFFSFCMFFSELDGSWGSAVGYGVFFLLVLVGP
jgi:hypothetical protein